MPGRGERLDSVGIGLVVVTVAWILLAAAVSGTNPLPMVAMVLLAAVALVVARGMAVRGRPLGAAAVSVVAAGLALLSFGGLAREAGGPLLYANANAAFFIQAALAGAVVALGWGTRGPRAS